MPGRVVRFFKNDALSNTAYTHTITHNFALLDYYKTILTNKPMIAMNWGSGLGQSETGCQIENGDGKLGGITDS